jgi:DNA-binding CsgD family transcriptional regulator
VISTRELRPLKHPAITLLTCLITRHDYHKRFRVSRGVIKKVLYRPWVVLLPSQKPMDIQKLKKLCTARQVEVLKRLASGQCNKVIAAELGISIKTVEKHRQCAYNKLGVHNSVEATHLAIWIGLVNVIPKEIKSCDTSPTTKSRPSTKLLT